MNATRLLLREIQFRKLNFALALLSVVAAVAFPVSVLTMVNAADREITRLMRDMGFNLLIVPAETDMADFWSRQYAAETMPEEFVNQLSESTKLQIRHLVARLQQKIEWRGRKVLLTGLLPEVQMQVEAKGRMDNDVPEGHADLGYELWKSEGLAAGDTIEVAQAGRSVRLVIDECRPEQGSIDDIRLSLHLSDAQAVLDMAGRITDIQALSCYCQTDLLAELRANLATELPGTQITEFRSQALARSETRATIERYAAFLIPGALVVCAAWIGLLALGNARERRAEIGVLRAMGVGSTAIGALFLGKALVVGAVGAAISFPLGTWAAMHFGPSVFPMTASKIAPEWNLLIWALIGAPALCAVASYIPAVLAMTQDPAEVLREE